MVVISLPHASLLHPIALRRPPGPQQSSFISAKQTRVAIPLPRCKCSKRGFFGMLYPTARPKPETPLRTSTAPVPGVAAHLLSGVSPSGTILRSFPGQKPRLSKVLPDLIPYCKCSKRGFRFVAGHRALLGAETPLSICEALRLWGWRLAGIAKPQPKNKAGAGDQPGALRVRPLP